MVIYNDDKRTVSFDKLVFSKRYNLLYCISVLHILGIPNTLIGQCVFPRVWRKNLKTVL